MYMLRISNTYIYIYSASIPRTLEHGLMFLDDLKSKVNPPAQRSQVGVGYTKKNMCIYIYIAG